VPAFVVLEVDGLEEEQALDSPGDLRLTWVHRTLGPGQEPELALSAVRALDLPAGAGQAFVHGEATAVRTLRRHLLVERGLPAEALSASGYWKLRRSEEGWREDKAEWRRLADADVTSGV
jgi:NADPH-dependent ferric siderophore reductase